MMFYFCILSAPRIKYLCDQMNYHKYDGRELGHEIHAMIHDMSIKHLGHVSEPPHMKIVDRIAGDINDMMQDMSMDRPKYDGGNSNDMDMGGYHKNDYDEPDEETDRGSYLSYQLHEKEKHNEVHEQFDQLLTELDETSNVWENNTDIERHVFDWLNNGIDRKWALDRFNRQIIDYAVAYNWKHVEAWLRDRGVKPTNGEYINQY
jgi:hypothetical protein